MSTAESEDGAPSSHARFSEQVRRWREEAIFQAVAQLLAERGCRSLTMDQVAKRVGIAKGSLYLHTTTRTGLVSELLDRWAEEVPSPDAVGAEGDDAVQRVCLALFQPVDDGHGAMRPAIPCCLATSPCPHNWATRWDSIATTYGLNGSPIADVLGEAVQSLGSTPSVRKLVEENRFREAADVLHRILRPLNTTTVA